MKFNYSIGVTHGGVFHADDVFSAALLNILNKGNFFIQRVVDMSKETWIGDEIFFDIGLGEFDHHQKNVPVRSNGIKYAAFGLLWKKFGTEIMSEKNAKIFDDNFVSKIDLQDNGGMKNPMSGAISSFVPSWDSEESMDESFKQAVIFAIDVLEREFSMIKSAEKAEKEVAKALENSISRLSEVVILPKFMPWQSILIPSDAKFVIFPSARGGYNATAIPKEIGSRENKVDFPKEWRAESKEFLESVVSGMNFCHIGGFIISTETLQGAEYACALALSKSK
jgi:uncharacterized UPF0160 family protein